MGGPGRGNTKKILIEFDRPGGRINVFPNEISRTQPSPDMEFAGGYKIREIAFSLTKFDSDRWGHVCFGMRGTVLGASSDGNTKKLLVEFDSACRWNVFPNEISRTQPSPDMVFLGG